MVIAILGFFLDRSYAFAPPPALIIPLPLVNKFPNKLAPNVPNNMLKNPPFFFFTSCSIVLPTPFNKMPDFSKALFSLYRSCLHPRSLI